MDEPRDYNIEDMGLIECVPNVSEGRRLEVVGRLAGDLQRVPGIRLLDFSQAEAYSRRVPQVSPVLLPHAMKIFFF